MEKKDPLVPYNEPSELKISAEFLTTWLPFLTKTLCHHCTQSLSNRVRSLDPGFVRENQSPPLPLKEIHCGCDMKYTKSLGSWKDSSIENSQLATMDNCEDTNSLGSWKDGANENSNHAVIDDCNSEDRNSLGSWKESPSGYSQAAESNNACVHYDSASDSHRLSWADMTQEEEHDDDDDLVEEEPQSKLTYKERRKIQKNSGETLSREQREYLRFKIVQRTKDFNCMRWIDGRMVNILEGLELHTGVFSAAEQKRIVEYIYDLEEKGKRGELQERTYSAPEKWMPGKGHVTLQFGCCYNYAALKDGSPPGILRNKPVDPLPHLFKMMIRRLVAWHVLPPTCVPDSCIVNIYEEGDCIPLHIDHHDFVCPFCTVSFLSECDILFGAKLTIVGPGNFSGDVAIPLPLGSVLVLNGNGADVTKHCMPGVPTKRISITFRKMDKSKHPIGYVPDPDLQGIQPFPYDVDHSEDIGKTRKKLLVLDLNGLLVDIVSNLPKGFKADERISSKALQIRPFCHDFLKFCFAKFDVGVWSSRMKKNVDSVVNFIMADKKQELLFCWDLSHCTETGFNTVENYHKPLVFKELKKLWDKHTPNLPWEKGVYNESNTLLLDDSPYKALLNPPNTAIFPNSYDFQNLKDNSLGPGGDLRMYLERLATAENIQNYIQQNPFGQRAVTNKNPSWGYYLKVINANKFCLPT